jgi:hypothetical protein
MLSLSSILVTVGPSELPALLLFAATITTHRKERFGRRKLLIYGLALLQVAMPALMAVSAAVFSHDRGVIPIARATEGRLSQVLFGLYLLQFPVGLLIAFFVTSWFRKTKQQVIIASLLAALLMVQMCYSFILMFAALLEISGDSI